jgi:tRNA A-37 threonylcarbamoyl transferase component Bud32
MNDSLLELIGELAEEYDPMASLIYGSRVAGYARENSLYDCMAICHYPGGARYHLEKLNGDQASILEIDEELFILDVKKGALGGFVAGRMLFPYLGLKGLEYLKQKEVELKKEVIRRDIEYIIQQYGEASRGIIIDPNYFAVSYISRLSKTFPPIRYSYLNTFRSDLRKKNIAKVMSGYDGAIEQLVNDGILHHESLGISIGEDFIDDIISRSTADKVVNVVEISRKALSSYLMHGRAGLVSPELISRELASKFKREFVLTTKNPKVKDPRIYLSLKTKTGLIPIDARGDIREIIVKIRPDSRILINPLGGVLNEVYLVHANGEKLVAKKFTDWHGFKWFTLNLVALGTKSFFVSGKARLTNEFGINHLLQRNFVNVPEIFHISISDRILVEKYVDGISVVDIIKKIVSEKKHEQSLYESISDVGRNIAKVHTLGIQLGDSKPENFIRNAEGKVFILDLEQAKKGGDFAWDIAVFLYFSAHYSTPYGDKMKQLTESFIHGYKEQGNSENLRQAAGINYLKVFSFWAFPRSNYIVSNTLKKAT